MTRSIYPRELAVKTLTQVLGRSRPLDEVLVEFQVGLSQVQVAWLQEICSGTLRWKGRLDLALDSTAIHKKPSGWLRKVLLIAAYQLIVQDRVHEGLVVSETVSLVKQLEGIPPAKFANACLRKISAHAKEWRQLDFPGGVDIHQEAAWASLPVWIWKKIVQDYGLEWAKSYATSSLERPVTWIRAKEAAWQPPWATVGPLQGAWKVNESGAIPQKEGFDSGQFIVQDLSNQLLIQDVTRSIKEKVQGPLTLLDLCAAPGGKSVGMAWNGFKVTATDQDESRVTLLKETVLRAAPEIQVTPWSKVEFSSNVIWIDAPCTGTGILRRHPDVRWLRQESSLIQLVQVQYDLLKRAWELVPPGGFLVYSVCSILKEEGLSQMEKIDFSKHCVQQWTLAPQIPPHGDGFWAALFSKPNL